MTPSLIFKSFNIATSIAGYFGLIENVQNNVQKLLHQSFKSAISNLQAALNADKEMKTFYIKQALVEFNAACSVEINENLISSLLGKAMCQHLLGDTANRDLSMRKIKDVQLSGSAKTQVVAKNIFKLLFFPGMMNDIIEPGRLEKFEQYKQLALSAK